MYYPFVFSYKHISLRYNINPKTMKKNLLSTLIVTANMLFTVFLASCGESYAPITLVSTDGQTHITNNDTIYIDAFTNGKEFNIKGGDGKYVLENQNSDIVRYEYNGEKVSLIPLKTGYGSLRITDYEKNESRFIINVKNQAQIFNVNDISTEVLGGELTQNETKIIEENIIGSAIMKVGGSIEFTYTLEEMNGGNVAIYPQKGENAITGIFSQNESFDSENGNKILIFEISLAGYNKINMNLIEKTENNYTYKVLRQDVTDTYRNQYPKLEKATIEYILADTTENK